MAQQRQHDLLEADNLNHHLPTDAPPWVHNALEGTRWVVALEQQSAYGHPVGVRGADCRQWYRTVAPHEAVVNVISPEDIAGVRAWPTRGLRAHKALRDVRAKLNQLGLPWGPIGSVGYELVSGIATVTQSSDLNLLIRVRACDEHRLDGLVSLQQNDFDHHPVPVDCLIETTRGMLRLAELALADRETPLQETAGASR
jgi:phosphoribosyl-dephospho-CoA transferase